VCVRVLQFMLICDVSLLTICRLFMSAELAELLQNWCIDTDKTLTMTNKLECGPMPSLMVALPKIGGALCSTPQSLADAHY